MSDNTAKALHAKEKGNKAFKQRNHNLAVKCFTEAISFDADNKVLYSNRAAAYTALAKNDPANFELAIADANKCIELDASWGKGYARLGAALFQKGDYEGAVKTYATGLGVDPSNTNITTGLQAAQKKMSAKKAKEEKKAFKPEDTIIGIDLGTTYSCVGVWKEDGVEIIANSLGDRTTPSWVSFLDGDRLVGQAAKNVAASNAKNTVYDIKRCIGQLATDEGVEKDIERFPFKVQADGNNRPVVHIDNAGTVETFLPEQISALVLAELKKTAEEYLGFAVNKAVITVPAYFNDAQRQATKAAGKIAGLEVKRIINEPTAAALSYGLDQGSDGNSNILIFDLGGGTFDVSILSIADGVFEVKATGGDTHLGGEDFDNAIVDHLIKEIERKKLGDIRDNTRAVRRLKAAAERAKRTLSNANVAEIEVESLIDGNDFNTKLTRAKFESLNSAFFARTIETVTKVLKDAKLKATDINEIVLVGGSTRIPKIQSDLSNLFDGKELCKTLNPDEAVAYGAAVQAGILSGRRNAQTADMLLMDVTPLSLGIETTGRVMSTVIPRNTPIPCVKQSTYTTEQDYQTEVDIAIYEGERMKTEHNNHLGTFTISGIERAKRGEPQIEVSFELNADGILKVKARDAKTGAENHIQIENKQTASQDEIERMVAEAKRFKKEDKERINKVDALNKIERVIYEVLEASKNQDSKLADVLEQSAMDTQDWLDEHGDSATSHELTKRANELQRRIQSRK